MKLAGAALAVAALTLLAACSSSGNAAGGSGTPTNVTSTFATAIASPSDSTVVETTTSPEQPPTNVTPSTSLPVSPSISPSKPSPTRSVPHTTCTSIDVRVIRGSASLGQEVAALQFTNSGTSSCVLVGYPTVTLLLKGKQIGRPSQPASTKFSSRALRPGQVAESRLHDYTQTCQAPLSDNVKVIVPGTSQTAVRPAQLRACILRVDRLGAPD